MHKLVAALGLAVAVPVALATPALAKSPGTATPSVSSVLRQHEGFRAEVTYLCTGPKHQEGTITVLLQHLAKPDANFDTVATANDGAKCDGQEREVKIKIPAAAGAVQADRTVRLSTTLVVNGKPVASHTSAPEPVAGYPAPTPSPSPTGTQTPSPSPSPTETEQPKPEKPSPSPTATS
jgi:hypothetical protein